MLRPSPSLSISGSATINGGTKTPTSLGPAVGSTNPGGYVQVAGSAYTPSDRHGGHRRVYRRFRKRDAGRRGPALHPHCGRCGGFCRLADQSPGGRGDVSNRHQLDRQHILCKLWQLLDFWDGDDRRTLSGDGDHWESDAELLARLSHVWGSGGLHLVQSRRSWRGNSTHDLRMQSGSNSGNSFIFDASFGSSASPPLPAGIPGLPGIGSPSSAMVWSQLNPDESVSGTIDVSPSQSQNFNFCLYGSIYIPAAGNYTFTLTYKDDVIWGIEGATLVSAPTTKKSYGGQTITVVKGYPLLPRVNESSGEGGGYGVTTVVVSFAAAGVYGIELDYDYWYHSGRILLLMGSPTALHRQRPALRLESSRRVQRTSASRCSTATSTAVRQPGHCLTHLLSRARSLCPSPRTQSHRSGRMTRRLTL